MSATAITASQMKTVIASMCDTIEEQKEYLCDLDGAIGDGDHGVSMAIAFGLVKQKLPEWPAQDVGSLLKDVALTLTNAVGGAMGPLFGTFFLKQAVASMGKHEVNLSDLVRMFQAAEKGIRDIGKANEGDKTLLDTLAPAVRALERAERDGKPLDVALGDLETAAREGWQSTRDLVAKTGRARRLGERTIGHLDPGATSCYFVLRAYVDAVRAD